MPKKSYLMCPPKCYSVDYSINPWMDDNIGKVDQPVAFKQWQVFREALHDSGASTKLVAEVRSAPDMCFTANSGMFMPLDRESNEKIFVLGYPRFLKERGDEGETVLRHVRRFCPNQGMLELPRIENLVFEGEADITVVGRTTIVGYGPRTNRLGITELYKMVPVPSQLLALQLVNPDFFNLDMCFFYHEFQHPTLAMDRRLIFAYKEAFDEASVKAIENFSRQESILLIWVPKEDAYRLACNAIGIGNRIILNNISQNIEDYLEKVWPGELEIVRVKLTEFLKAGGGAKSLVMEMPE